MASFKDLAIIIPVAPKELAWQDLLKDLLHLAPEIEILFVGPVQPPQLETLKGAPPWAGRQLSWIASPLGRAKQLNKAARSTEKPYLWFLHADSRLAKRSFLVLEKALNHDPKALYYLNLKFLNDGPSLTRINAVGAWIRSHCFSLPFGDQGFCISKNLFEHLAGFPENVPYGEDHLFVWRARQARIPVRALDAEIYDKRLRCKSATFQHCNR